MRWLSSCWMKDSRTTVRPAQDPATGEEKHSRFPVGREIRSLPGRGVRVPRIIEGLRRHRGSRCHSRNCWLAATLRVPVRITTCGWHGMCWLHDPRIRIGGCLPEISMSKPSEQHTPTRRSRLDMTRALTGEVMPAAMRLRLYGGKARIRGLLCAVRALPDVAGAAERPAHAAPHRDDVRRAQSPVDTASEVRDVEVRVPSPFAYDDVRRKVALFAAREGVAVEWRGEG